MEIIVRKADSSDYGALCELFDEVDALHRANLPQIFQKPTGPVRDYEYYLGLIADESVGLFVAQEGQQLLGFVHVVFRQSTPSPVLVPRRYAIIDGIGVKAESRKRGVGSSLSATASEWAVAKGADAIELNVYDFNLNAIAFYQSLGYETISHKMGKPLKNDKAAG
jgi:ribosomal protein S18 acetylase RimI-like enzyme